MIDKAKARAKTIGRRTHFGADQLKLARGL